MTVQPYEATANGGQVVRHESTWVASLRDWAEAARAAHVVAQSLVRTSFVPEVYRNKPDEATAAILAGAEVNLSPMASLNAYDIIQGRAAPKALTLRAICQSRGHRFKIVETTAQRCVMRCRRVDETDWDTITWDLARARTAGLTGKKQWREQPTAMLLARATSECARLVGADAILGIPYSAEELRDQGSDDATPSRARRRTAVAAVAPAPQVPAEPRAPAGPPPLPGEDWAPTGGEPAAEPTPDAAEDGPPDEAEGVDTPDEPAEADDEAADEPAADAEEGAGEPDMAYLLRYTFALLGQAEILDRHAYASEILGRAVQSYSELSADDLQRLIDALSKRVREAE